MKKTILFCILSVLAIYNLQAQNFEGNIVYKVIYTDTLLCKDCMIEHKEMPIFWNLWFKDLYVLDEMERNKQKNEESTYGLADFKKKIYLFQGFKTKGLQKRKIDDDCEVDKFEIIKTNEFDDIYGKKCAKYIIKRTSNQQICEMWTWQNPTIKLPKKIQPSFFCEIQPYCFMEKIGFPMRIRMMDSESEYVKTYTTLEVIKIENQKLELSFFEKYKKLLKPSIDLRFGHD